MAPAAASNWLSFSLSSMEMLANSTHTHSHSHSHTQATQIPQLHPSHHFFLDPFYSNEWGNAAKGQVMYADYVVETPTLTAVPKLEDFLGGDNTASYNSTTNATQDVDSSSHSQLTHLYDPSHHHNYFSDHPHQDLKAAVAFSANSGSEVDDCGSVGRTTQLGCGGATEFMTHSTESTQCVVAGNLSLGGVSQTSEKPTAAATTTAIVSAGGAESDGAKKIADTFGQRTSIYRGVTRSYSY